MKYTLVHKNGEKNNFDYGFITKDYLIMKCKKLNNAIANGEWNLSPVDYIQFNDNSIYKIK